MTKTLVPKSYGTDQAIECAIQYVTVIWQTDKTDHLYGSKDSWKAIDELLIIMRAIIETGSLSDV